MPPEKRLSPEEAAAAQGEWEAKLSGEGLGVELPPGADEEGKPSLESEKPDPEEVARARRALQYYWQFRQPWGYGDHAVTAVRIGKEMDIDPGILEPLIKVAEEDLAAARRATSDAIEETADINNPERRRRTVQLLAQRRCPDVDKDVLKAMIDDLLDIK